MNANDGVLFILSKINEYLVFATKVIEYLGL